MPQNIIVMGANGRMGRTIINLIMSEPELRLAGAVEIPSNMEHISGLPCPVSDSIEKLLETQSGVIIDFTSPLSSLENAKIAASHSSPIVIGTTGFDKTQRESLENFAMKTPILWSANMSIGINVLARLLPELARALGNKYDMEIVEIHHGKKKDAPSGTALLLGNALASARGWELDEVRNSCRDGETGQRPEEEIGIMALRGGDVVGIHQCYFLGPGEIIEISHQAESRENFGQGALRAAKWLAGQKCGKLYSMQDVLFDKK